MTAYNPRTQAPTAITTLEMNLVHSMMTLDSLYSGTSYREQESSAVDSGLRPNTDFSIVRIADGSVRAIGRFAIALPGNYASVGGQKLWTLAQPLGSVTIPTAFLTN